MQNKTIMPRARKDLKPETLKTIQQVLDKIPKLPISVQRIIDMTMDDDIGAKELAEVALTDPVLSSKILTQVNSAYYGFNRRIDDMRVAIVLIGFNAVRNIAIQNRFQQVFNFSDMDGLEERERLWMHSYLVSVCAETFADEDDFKRLGVLATMGILHDIGKYALYNIGMLMKKKGLLQMLSAEYESYPLIKREEILYGVNHAVIGGMLANKWNLSERICAVLEYHHHPSFFSSEMVPDQYRMDIATICAADAIVNRFQHTENAHPDPSASYLQPFGAASVEDMLTPSRHDVLDKATEFIESLQEP